MKYVSLICYVCGKAFVRKKGEYEHTLRRAVGEYKPKCSRECVRIASIKLSQETVSLFCEECGKQFERSCTLYRQSLKRGGKIFCSIACLGASRRKKSIDTPAILRRKSFEGVTKGMLFERRKNWQSARSGIQQAAREIYKKSDKAKQCLKCGYDLHYEVCHIKDVSSFTDDTLISEINDLDNLIALCPTHHWEFDNKILKFEDV